MTYIIASLFTSSTIIFTGIILLYVNQKSGSSNWSIRQYLKKKKKKKKKKKIKKKKKKKKKNNNNNNEKKTKKTNKQTKSQQQKVYFIGKLNIQKNI
jgi:sortase (surface protein transpeptidase)